MNHIYKLVWNALHQAWVAVSEVASSVGSRSTTDQRHRPGVARETARMSPSARFTLKTIAACAGGMCAGAVFLLNPGQVSAQTLAPTTLPQGGVVTQGAATLQGAGSSSAPVLNVNQTSQRAVVNWNSFNLGSAATVNFNQPNAQSATLNRVLDMNPSQIFGHINAPGQVTLVNPAGVYFSPSAVLDVGALTATTLGQTDADFMAGKASFQRNGSTGSVVNEGTLKAVDTIALLAPEVRNQGTITASAVVMAAGESIQLNFDAFSRLASLSVTPSQIKTLVENKTAILAPGGLIILSATALSGLQASVIHSGQIDASSLSTKGGRIVLEGDSIQLSNGSRLNASGATGGGTVLVGGDWQGSGTMAQATTVAMAQGATIDASATQSGDGGRVVLWSDVGNASGITTVNGRITASGIATGGQVETSGHMLDTKGAQVVASGLVQAGQWLLDPYNITIASSGASGTPYSASYASAATSTILASDIAASLDSGTNVTISTGPGSAGAGDINVNASIAKTAGGNAFITLRAHNDIVLASGVSITSTSGTMRVVFNSDLDGNGSGSILLNTNSGISSNGGNITLGGGVAGDGTGNARGNSGQQQGIKLSTSTLNAGGGNIVMNGQGYAASNVSNAIGVELNSSSSVSTTDAGSISLTGTGGAGTGTSAANQGVRVSSSTVTGGSSGSVSLVGTGGAAPGNFNYGVNVTGSTASVTSTGGNVVVNGTGAGTGTSGTNAGVAVQAGAVVQAGGSGTVGLTGTGGGGTGTFNEGVLVLGANTRISSAGGAVTLAGTGGGTGSGSNNYGVDINAAATVQAGGSGTLSITGTGGATSGNDNAGIYISDASTLVTSAGGAVNLVGTGKGSGTSDSNYGVTVATSATVQSGGAGALTITGTGGTTTGGFGYGVAMFGGTITSDGGNVSVTGQGRGSGASGSNRGVYLSASGGQITAGGSGTVTVQGTGGGGTGTDNEGVYITSNLSSISGNGNVTVTGQGGAAGTGSNNLGIWLENGGKISGTGSGTVTASGTGGGTAGTVNHGVYLSGSPASSITTAGGALSLSGTAGGGTASYGVALGSAATASTASDAAITITTDSLSVDTSGTPASISAGNGTVQVQNRTAGTLIGLGGGDVLSGSPLTLGLTDAEIDRVTAGTLVIGRTGANASGYMTVGANISPALAKNLTLLAGGDITLNANTSITMLTNGAAILNSDADGNGAGAIRLGTSTSIVSNGGNIALGGGAAGDASGFAVGSSQTMSQGVFMVNASVLATGGNISIRGIGLASTFGSQDGVSVNTSTVSTTGAGSVTVVGVGGAGTSSSSKDRGVAVTAGATITGGSTGLVSVTGTGGGGAQGKDYGVHVTGSGSAIGSTGGNVSVTGIGGGAAATIENYGIWLDSGGRIAATGTGTVTVLGTGGNTTGASNLGVYMDSGGAAITSVNGAIAVTGASSSGSRGFFMSNTTNITSTGNAAVTVTADSVGIGTTDSISAGTGTVQIQNRTAGTLINLGAADVLTGSPLTLGLIDAEIDRITAGTLIVGRNDAAAAGTITVSSAITPALATSLALTTSAGIAINAPVTLGSNSTLTLTAAGSVNQLAGGNLTATNLLLDGVGSYALATATSNAISAIAASGTGAISYKNSSALQIGTVSGVNGISASGAVNIGTASGDLTVAQNVTTSDTSSAAVLLNAGVATAAGTGTGGNIVVSGNPSVTVGSGGRATLMTGSVSGSTGLASLVGAGSGRFRYNSDESTTNYSSALGSGNYAIYREAPTATVTLNNVNKTYDGNAYSGGNGYATSGLANGDSFSGSIVYGGSSQGAVNVVGSPYTISGSGLGTGQGYTVNYTSGNLTINPYVVNITGSRSYNGNANVAAGIFTLGTLVGSETLTLGGTGTVVSKNVGTGKTVTLGSLALGNGTGLANNYTLGGGTATATITQASLLVTGVGAVNKVYDATTAATLTGTAAVAALGGDVVTVGGTGTGSFTNKNVGTGKAVTVSGYTLGGVDAANYAVVQPTGVTANITQASLAVTGVGAANKVYDTTTAATLTGTAVVTTLGSDVVTVGGPGAGSFANKNVGTGKSVTVSGFTLGGTDAGNYTVLQPTGVTANITQASLNVTGIGAVNKIYDTTTAATLTGTAAVAALGGDTVTVGGTGVGNFANKNVGTGKAVSASGYTLGGADALNYAVVQPTGVTANITQASLAVTGVGAANKVYDATTTATLTGTATVTALGGDVVTVGGTGTGSFANKNVGTGKAVTVGGYTLGGADAANYAVVQPTGLAANITQASLAITGIGAANKVYDTTTTATLTGTAAVAALGGDVVTVGGTGAGSFGSKNVGTAKTVNVSGYTLGGADAANYAATQPTGVAANITQASLAVTGVGAANKVYDATTSASLTGTAVVAALGSDVVTVGGTGVGGFADKNVGAGKTVAVSGYALSGADAANYAVVQPTGVTASITQAMLTISGIGAANKVYDATTTATLTGTAAVTALGGDMVTVGGTGTGSFADKNVGTGKAVTVGGYTLGGADAANYAVVQPTGLTANTTQASLNVTGIGAASKVYDAGTAATLTGTAAVAALGGDTVTVGGTGVGNFVNKNVGTGKAVTVGGYTLGGADAANYTVVQPTGLTANITQASLAVTGVGAVHKVYDASTAAMLTGTATVAALGGDVVTVGGPATGNFANKNVGTGKTVAVSGYTLGGADAANYAVVQPSGLVANITQASLAVTGVGAANKVYDTTTAATLTGTAAVTALGGDVVTVEGPATGNFANKNVGTGKTVTVNGYTLGGADAANYTVAQPTGVTASIMQASLAVTGVGAAHKVYDAGTTATLTGTAAVAALGGDTVTVGGTGTGSFADKNVGADKTVAVSGYALGGADAANYAVVQPTGVTADITQATLAITGIGVANKVYDTTTAATLTGTAVVAALGSDVVTVGGTGTGSFADKNMGTGKAVTVGGYTLGGADAANYAVVQPTSVTANITQASLAVTGVGAANKVYDASTAATLTGTGSVTALGSDTVAVGGTGVGSFADKNVGTGKTVTVNGYTLGGADAANYAVVQPTGVVANITQASLAVTGVGAVNKVYDATTVATLTGTAVVAALGSDTVAVGGTGVGSFADKNVGTGKTVTVSGYTLGGADAANYAVVQPAGVTANITQASLAVTGVGTANKVYDATTAATLTGTATVSALGGDVVAVGGGVGSFADKSVGTGKTVAVSGYTLSGADAANYAVAQPTGLTANITQASLNVTGVGAANKVYDTTTTATVVGTAVVTALGSDVVSVSGAGVASFADKNVGSSKTVAVSGYTLSGTDAANYAVVQPTGVTANITQASLAVTGVGAASKVYDATTTATLTGTAVAAALGSDVVTVVGPATGQFADKNVGAAKTVTVSGYTLGGADAANYAVVQPTSVTANITQASLAVTGVGAANKVYDASTAATLTGTAEVMALGSDVVTVAGAGVGSFANKNVGTGKTVAVSGYTLGGADASNYAVVQPAGVLANITQANLVVTGVGTANKTYDATTAATLTGAAAVTALGGDAVTLGGTGIGNFVDKNAGMGKVVNVSGYTLGGADAANYTVTQPTGVAANITQASLAVTGVGADNKVYDASTAATLTGTAAVTALGSDVVAVGGPGTGSFANKNVGTGKLVAVSGYTLSGTDAANYAVVQPTGIAADITQASLVVTGVGAAHKVYDASTAATLTGTATVAALGSDVVAVGGTGTGSFANKNVGTGKAVTLSGYSLSGADASNYTVVQPTGVTASITPASLAITGIGAAHKVYDATTAATLTGTTEVAVLGSDVVTVVGPGAGSFADKNVGTGKAVTVSGYTLGGADAGNYAVAQPTGVVANITQASLAVTGVGAASKVYDATTTATLTGTAVAAALGSDVVTVVGPATGQFADKNVGAAKTVTVSGYTLGGADAANYAVVQPTSVTANITQASLAVTGVGAANKVYDASTAATLTGTGSVTALGSDTVAVGGTGVGSFADKNVGTGKTVAVNGYTLGGADAANYAVVQPTGVVANITQASLAVTGVGAAHKVYDATTVATLTGTAVVAALGSDTVAVGGTGVGSFADKNVGTGKTVAVSGYTLGGADAANYAVVQPAGVTANITQASLAVTGVGTANKVYDATTAATLTGTAAVSALGGDVVAVGGGVGSFADKSVGTGKTVAVSGYTLSGADAANYAVAQPTGLTANITQASLNVTGVGAANKVYDTTTTATVVGTAVATALGSDVVSVSGAGVASFADKNVGSSKTVAVSGYTLSGTDAANYAVAQPTGVVANITQASLAVTGVGAASKVYDATTTATLTGTAVAAALGSDVVTVVGPATGQFADKNVGAAKTVTVSGYTLGGVDAANYAVVQPTSVTANITQASLAVTGVGAANKVYDASTAATLTGTGSVTALGSDTVAVGGTGVGSFADKNVGTGKTVTVNGYTLGGADAVNYAVVQPTGVAANITQASLAVTGVGAVNKVYDASTAATLTGTATVAALGSDAVALGGTGVGSFANKNVGTGKTVAVSGYTLSGADAANYAVVQPTGLTANITQASLAVTGVGTANKVYDATTAATLTGTAAVSALGGDVVAVGGGVGSFADKSVGTGKTVAVSGYTLSGADAANYAVAQPTGLTANITQASLNVTGVGAANKVYDTTTTATVVGTAVATALGSDVVSVSGAGVGSFADKNVGSSKTVAVSGYTLSGTDAANYAVVQPTGVTANITQASLAVTGVGAANKVYDATTSASLTGTAAVAALGSDVVAVGGAATGSFADKNVGTGKAVTVSGYTLGGTDAANYAVVQPTGIAADITQASLAVTGVGAAHKVYDASTAATLTGTAAVTALGSDAVALGGTAVGNFADKNVGTGKAVQVSGYTLGGADAANYALLQPTGVSASISPAPLVVSANADARFVTQADTPGYFGASYSGLVGGETSSVLGGTLAITRPNAATDVAAGSYAGALVPSGLVSGNYTISYTNGGYTIVPANQLLVRVANTDSVYGSTPSLGIVSVQYLDVNNTTIHALTGSGTGNSFSYADGAGGSIQFTLSPQGAVTSTGGQLAVGHYALADAGPTVVGGNFVGAPVFVGNLGVAQKAVSANVSTVTKVYDGTAGLAGAHLGLAGQEAGDTLSVNGTGTFAQKNVGSKQSYAFTNIALTGADVANYYLVGGNSLIGSNGSITPASLTVSTANVVKTFDGTTSAAGSAVVTSGTLFGSDSLGGGSFAFTDPSVGLGNKTVTTAGVVLNDGNGGNNYQVAYANNTTSTIQAAPPTPVPPVVPVVPVPPVVPVEPVAPLPAFLPPPALTREVLVPQSASPVLASPAATATIATAGAVVAGCMGTSQAVQDCGRSSLQSGFVLVTPVRNVSPTLSGQVMVQVSEQVLRGGAFEAGLPLQTTIGLRAGSVPAVATRPDGRALPDWLQWDPQNLVLVARAMPAGALPSTVVVGTGEARVEVEITALP